MGERSRAGATAGLSSSAESPAVSSAGQAGSATGHHGNSAWTGSSVHRRILRKVLP